MSKQRFGPEITYIPADGNEHEFDIVFVHGLFGHPRKSFTAYVSREGEEMIDVESSGDEPQEQHTRHFQEPPRKKQRKGRRELLEAVFWPKDLLPKAFPKARITTWGYDVQIGSMFSSKSNATIFHHAQTLLSDLTMLRCRALDKAKPIIFIAHSLGGIIVKDALSLSKNDLTYLSEVEPATHGVIFLGTPHHGSQVATLGKRAFELSKLFFRSPNESILRGLEENSEILERITRSFGQLLATGHVKVHSFREELDTYGARIVDTHSSSIGYLYETSSNMHANHRSMAKMTSLQDVKFQRVVAIIQRWLGEAMRSPSGQGPNDDNLPDSFIFDKEYQKCMESLNFADARSRIEEVGNAHAKTYDWIFESALGFRDWLAGEVSNTIYWIQGKPGSGKSTLMKYAMRHPTTKELLGRLDSSPWVVAAYFFHDRGVEIQKSISGFLQEILYQLLRQHKELYTFVHHIISEANPKWARDLPSNNAKEDDIGRLAQKHSSQTTWTLKDLQEALLAIASRTTRSVNVCVFVDALDEHDGDHRQLLTALEQLSRLSDNHHFKLRLCLAGRQENIFKDAFRHCPGFPIHEHTTTDIRVYTEGRIQDAVKDKLTRDGELSLSKITEEVIRRAEGVFLWVRLVTDELIEGLCEGDSMEELIDILSGIPTELEDLYTRTLRRYNRNQNRATAKYKYERYVMFQIVKYCLKPFSLYGLLGASLYLTTGRGTYPELQRLSDDQMERRLYSRSAGLLDTAKRSESRSDAKVQFIHQTMKEYMTTGIGSAVLIQDIGAMPQDPGYILIFRYLVSLLACFEDNNLDLDAQQFATRGFAYYAQQVEFFQSAIKIFQPATSKMTDAQRRRVMTEILDQEAGSPWSDELNALRDKEHAQSLFFYLVLCLKASVLDYLRGSEYLTAPQGFRGALDDVSKILFKHAQHKERHDNGSFVCDRRIRLFLECLMTVYPDDNLPPSTLDQVSKTLGISYNYKPLKDVACGGLP